MLKGFEQDQDRHGVSPGLGSNCMQRLYKPTTKVPTRSCILNGERLSCLLETLFMR